MRERLNLAPIHPQIFDHLIANFGGDTFSFQNHFYTFYIESETERFGRWVLCLSADLSKGLSQRARDWKVQFLRTRARAAGWLGARYGGMERFRMNFEESARSSVNRMFGDSNK